MRYALLVVVFLPCFVNAQAPRFELQSMIDAELAFAKLSLEKGTAQAFLEFLSDSAITFGAKARKGKKHLEEQTNDGSWLHWEPTYSDISASGDFGFNTGPWELREDRSAGEPVAYGQFATVWKKDNGVWRAALDIGIAHARPASKLAWTTSSIDLAQITTATTSLMARVIAEEQKFISEFNTKKNQAYHRFLSHEARIYRHQHEPLTTQSLHEVTYPRAKAYKFIDGEISSSGDLAYVYGEALIDADDKGKPKQVEGNYLRIWKKEDGRSWKIVLDVLTYL